MELLYFVITYLFVFTVALALQMVRFGRVDRRDVALYVVLSLIGSVGLMFFFPYGG